MNGWGPLRLPELPVFLGAAHGPPSTIFTLKQGKNIPAFRIHRPGSFLGSRVLSSTLSHHVGPGGLYGPPPGRCFEWPHFLPTQPPATLAGFMILPSLAGAIAQKPQNEERAGLSWTSRKIQFLPGGTGLSIEIRGYPSLSQTHTS